MYVFSHRVVAMLICGVDACATAGKLPPPGWTKPDDNGKGVSLSDVSRFGESVLP